MPSVTVTLRRSFPRRAGMGAVQHGSHLPYNAYHGTAIVTTQDGSSSSTGTTSSPSSSAGFPGRRGRPSWQAGQQSQQGSSWNSQGGWGGGSSNDPSQSTLTAFQQALSTAAQYSVITPTQAAQFQSEANTATDSQLQQITAQLNALISTAPTAATLAATTATTATTSTSWLDGQTALFGTEVNNSTLLIGLIVGMGGLYLVTRKK